MTFPAAVGPTPTVANRAAASNGHGVAAPRFQYARCECRCGWWVVLDTARHELLGVSQSAFRAGLVADRLNRGLPVYYAEDAA